MDLDGSWKKIPSAAPGVPVPSCSEKISVCHCRKRRMTEVSLWKFHREGRSYLSKWYNPQLQYNQVAGGLLHIQCGTGEKGSARAGEHWVMKGMWLPAGIRAPTAAPASAGVLPVSSPAGWTRLSGIQRPSVCGAAQSFSGNSGRLGGSAWRTRLPRTVVGQGSELATTLLNAEACPLRTTKIWDTPSYGDCC